jgi:hypothetical protein
VNSTPTVSSLEISPPPDLENGQSTGPKKVEWLGRKFIPVSSANVTHVHISIGGYCGTIALASIIAGAVLWGAYGSNTQLELAGKILVGCGLGIVSLVCCCGCLLGSGKANE